MSVLDITSESYSITIGDIYTTSMVYGKILSAMGTCAYSLEKHVLNSINTCPVDKWPFGFLNSVKSYLNEHILVFNLDPGEVIISVEPHPFSEELVVLNFESVLKHDFIFAIFMVKKPGLNCPGFIQNGECIYLNR